MFSSPLKISNCLECRQGDDGSTTATCCDGLLETDTAERCKHRRHQGDKGGRLRDSYGADDKSEARVAIMLRTIA